MTKKINSKSIYKIANTFDISQPSAQASSEPPITPQLHSPISYLLPHSPVQLCLYVHTCKQWKKFRKLIFFAQKRVNYNCNKNRIGFICGYFNSKNCVVVKFVDISTKK